MKLVAFLLVIGLWAVPNARAQRFQYAGDQARAVQAVYAGYTAIVFDYNGNADTLGSALRFDYEGPAYGATYLRPNFTASLAIGSGQTANVEDPRDLWVVTASVDTWGEFYPLPALATERARLFIPILLHTDYRRVAQRDVPDTPTSAFSVTSIGLGTGLGFYGQPSDRLLVSLRATPVIGLAARSFGESAGNTRLFAGSVDLHLGPFVQRVGVSLGYTFRTQVWNVSGSDLFNAITDDLFDYRGYLHALRLGVNF